MKISQAQLDSYLDDLPADARRAFHESNTVMQLPAECGQSVVVVQGPAEHKITNMRDSMMGVFSWQADEDGFPIDLNR